MEGVYKLYVAISQKHKKDHTMLCKNLHMAITVSWAILMCVCIYILYKYNSKYIYIYILNIYIYLFLIYIYIYTLYVAISHSSRIFLF